MIGVPATPLLLFIEERGISLLSLLILLLLLV